MSLRGIEFLYPNGIYVSLALVVLLFLWIYFYLYRKRVLEKVIPKPFHSSLIRKQPGYIYWGRAFLTAVVWMMAVAALMSPFGLGEYKVDEGSSVRTTQEVIFLVDVSASMAVTDARYGKDRLETAKDIIDSLMQDLAGQNVSLYYFTSHAFRAVPPTMDYLFLRLMSTHLQLNEGEVGGSDLVTAMQKIIEELKKKPLAVVKTIILFTDGGDALYETTKDAEQDKRKTEILKLASELEKLNAHLLIVGTGSLQGGIVPGVTDAGKPVKAVLQQSLLQAMAAAAHGVYFASNDQPNADLEAKLLPRMTYAVPTVAASEIASQERLVPELYFQIPLAIALLLLIFVL